MEVKISELADLRMDQLLNALCAEAERVQFNRQDTADLLWEAARRLDTIQREARLLDRTING